VFFIILPDFGDKTILLAHVIFDIIITALRYILDKNPDLFRRQSYQWEHTRRCGIHPADSVTDEVKNP
jgi:hypothetical protein